MSVGRGLAWVKKGYTLFTNALRALSSVSDSTSLSVDSKKVIQCNIRDITKRQRHATALLRDDGRVVGVMTEEGPVYANVVFLAEGDAAHLVTREGYEEVAQPHFAQGVKAVLSLPCSVVTNKLRKTCTMSSCN